VVTNRREYTIADLTHPAYDRAIQEWLKWRYTYRGGAQFINTYLQQYSQRESIPSFQKRKSMTYNPSFSKEAINEIKNSLFQRFVDVTRTGGSQTYQRAVLGEDGGVDLLGSSMNAYIGRKILSELLVMGKVGIFVDMPILSGITIAENMNKRPYLYIYKAEDIRTWRFDTYDSQTEFSTLLLREYVYQYDEVTGLPMGQAARFRHIWLEDGKVHVQFYDEGGSPTFFGGQPQDEADPIVLNIDRIPFVVAELSDSLLVEAANYQIALMNIASSDIGYILQSNYPFYTEQYEPRTDSPHLKTAGLDTGGSGSDAGASKTQEIMTGTGMGRRYPKGLDRPEFINPSSEPLKASMAKQEQIKAEIRQLVHLSVANLQPRDASAESKSMDNQGLENGLSYIGLELENAERKIADYWSMYENSRAATVKYPEKYSLRTESDRREEAKQLSELLERVPSRVYQKEVAKRIAQVLLGNKVSNEVLGTIMAEIDKAVGMTATVEVIAKHVEIGILDLETASKMCNYPEGTVEKAAKDHSERLARIAAQQGIVGGDGAAARGVSDLDPSPGATGAPEKGKSRETAQDAEVRDKVRGKGKKRTGQ